MYTFMSQKPGYHPDLSIAVLVHLYLDFKPRRITRSVGPRRICRGPSHARHRACAA